MNKIKEFPFLEDLCDKVSELCNVGFEFNQVEIINYKTKGAGLACHMDPITLFEYPIVSLRLFLPRTLWFGCTGQGQVETEFSWSVRQERGQITIMSGLSATHFKHSVKSEKGTDGNQNEKSVSIVFRRVRGAGLDLQKNTQPYNSCLLN